MHDDLGQAAVVGAIQNADHHQVLAGSELVELEDETSPAANR